MAHYAELDTNNIVLRVLVVHNEVTHVNGVEDEKLGEAFLSTLFPDSGRWIQTSYNANIRKRYAGIGYIYDEERDEFVPPDWVLINNEWVPPLVMKE